jgi:hypothetical protein
MSVENIDASIAINKLIMLRRILHITKLSRQGNELNV